MTGQRMRWQERIAVGREFGTSCGGPPKVPFSSQVLSLWHSSRPASFLHHRGPVLSKPCSRVTLYPDFHAPLNFRPSIDHTCRHLRQSSTWDSPSVFGGRQSCRESTASVGITPVLAHATCRSRYPSRAKTISGSCHLCNLPVDAPHGSREASGTYIPRLAG